MKTCLSGDLNFIRTKKTIRQFNIRNSMQTKRSKTQMSLAEIPPCADAVTGCFTTPCLICSFLRFPAHNRAIKRNNFGQLNLFSWLFVAANCTKPIDCSWKKTVPKSIIVGGERVIGYRVIGGERVIYRH